MILSRLWYIVLSLALGASLFVLWAAAGLYNRSGLRAMSEALSADSSAVAWYLKDDASNRSAALIPVALHPDIRAGLAKASSEDTPSREVSEKTRATLRKLADEVEPDLQFDTLWAVDSGGRVIATAGDVVTASEGWELGGYPVVADALHGWIRDDAWVWRGRILRVVARPVEQDANAEPVGAIVGVKVVDDKFATAASKRTGAAVGFYAEGSRVASWAPEGFDKANLDVITQDLKLLDDNKDYQEKGRSEPRIINAHLGVVYARLPGEAWELGAGYAVGRLADSVTSPFDFMSKASEDDKKTVPTLLIALAALGAVVIGLGLTLLEHTKPLSTFRKEASRFAAGTVDALQPSKLGGVYRKIASDVNDGIEKVLVKGGGSRRAADLQQVLGPIPAEPAMSAFAVPGAGGDAPRASGKSGAGWAAARPEADAGRASGKSGAGWAAAKAPPAAADAPATVAQKPAGAKPPVPAPKRPGGAEPVTLVPQADERASIPAHLESLLPDEPELAPAPPRPAPAIAGVSSEPTMSSPSPSPDTQSDELVEWRHVYEEFLGVKRQCGEGTATLTFEKFKGTLERNKAALVARHGCSRVKFTVYVKDGKAALKASPVR